MNSDPITPYVTSTIANVKALTGTINQVASIAQGVSVASQSLGRSLPNVSSLASSMSSVSSLTNRLGASASLTSGLASAATSLTNSISSAASSLTSAFSGLTSGKPIGEGGASTAFLAPTTFSTGVNNKLAALDVYSATTANTLVDITQATPSLDIASVLSVANSALGTIATLVNDYKIATSLTLSPSAMLNGLLASDPNLQAAFNSLPLALQEVMKVAAKLSGGQSSIRRAGSPLSAIYVSNNGISTTNSNSTLQDIAGLVSIVSALSGGNYSPLVKDFTATVVLMQNVMSVAASMRLPGAFTAMVNGVTGSHRMVGSITSSASNSAVSTGSAHLLSEISQVRTHSAITSYPNLIVDFSKNYKLETSESTANHAAIANKLNAAYSSISPTWHRATTQTGEVYSLNSLINSSKDLKSIIKAHEETAFVPLAVIPTSVITIPAAKLGSYVLPTGTGITKTNVTNPDGSKTYTVLYPAQLYPLAQPDRTAIMAVGPSILNAYGLYQFPQIEIVSYSVDDANTTLGTLVLNQTLSDGTTQTLTIHSNGSRVLSRTDSDGVWVVTTLSTTVTSAQVEALVSVSRDPLAHTCRLVTSSPLIAASALQKTIAKDVAYARRNNRRRSIYLSAVEALTGTFVHTPIINATSIQL